MAKWSDPDERCAYQANRRTRDVEGRCTADDLRQLRAAQGDRCAYCQIALNEGGELDHFVAVTRGGSSHPSNLRWACKPCNRRKRTREAAEWLDPDGTWKGQLAGTRAGQLPIKMRSRFRDRTLYWWLYQPANQLTELTEWQRLSEKHRIIDAPENRDFSQSHL
jgi:hypothetical protein